MEKLIYLLWGEPANGSDTYRDALIDGLAPELFDRGAHHVTIDVDDALSNCPSPVPGRPGEMPHVAAVSVWLPASDHRVPIEEAIAGVGLRTDGYLVSGAVYTEYGDNEWAEARSTASGERSPSVLTVCLIHRPEGYDPTEWVTHWHGVQSPVSAEIQPRCRYVRNEVVRPVTDGAPVIDGIVEEAWPSSEHIVDPMLFFNGFGDRELMNTNIERMIDSVGSFIDMERIRNVTMSEYIFDPR